MNQDEIYSVPLSKGNPSLVSMNRKPIEPIQENQNHTSPDKIVNDEESRPIKFKKISKSISRINADNQSKSNLCISWTIFLVVIMVALITIAIFPSSYIQLRNNSQLVDSNIKGCHNPCLIQRQLKCRIFSKKQPQVGLVMLNISAAHQFAVIDIYLYLLIPETVIQIKQRVSMMLFQISVNEQSKMNKKYHQGALIDERQSLIEINSQSQKIFTESKLVGYKDTIALDRNFVDFCRNKQQCSFFLSINFHQTSQLDPIKTAQLKTTTVNPSFTYFALVFRLVFFFVSVIVGAIYILRYKKVKQLGYDHSFQQKAILALSVCLMIFNDPLYPITVLFSNPFNDIVSVVSLILLPIMLLFTWMMFSQRIFYQSHKNQTKLVTKKKICYFITLFGASLILYLVYMFHESFHPLIPLVYSQPLFIIPVSMVLVLYTLGIIYTLFMIIKILYRLYQIRNQTALLWRNVSQLISTVVVIITLTVVYMVGSFSIYDSSAPRLVIFYAVSNLYVVYLQYMYSVPKQTIMALEEYQKANKDNLGSQNSLSLEKIDNDQIKSIDIQIDLQGDESDIYGIIYPQRQPIIKQKQKQSGIRNLRKDNLIKRQSSSQFAQNEKEYQYQNQGGQQKNRFQQDKTKRKDKSNLKNSVSPSQVGQSHQNFGPTVRKYHLEQDEIPQNIV